MATNAVATAFVSIVPSLKGFEGNLRAQLNGEMDVAGAEGGKRLGGGLLASAKSFIGPLIATFAVVGSVNFFKDAVEQASTLSESQNAIKVTFGDAADAVAKLGEDSATRLGLSTSAFNGIATQFSAFAGTIAGAGGDVSKVVDELSTRGADFASVMNLEVSDALGLFQSGLAGETEPLRKFGIDMSAAAVEAYALANGIFDGTGEMTEAQKVQARYGALMEQTSKTAGDFANTSDGLANSQRIANAEMENARAKLGDQLLPIMADLTNFAADTFIPIIESMGDGIAWFKDNISWLTPILAGIGGVLLATAAYIGVMNLAAVIAAAGGLPAVIAATWAWTAALLANPITWIILGIGLLIGALVFLAMNWDAVVAFVTDVWNGFVSWFSEAMEYLGSWLSDVWAGISQWWIDLWEGIASFVSDVWDNIVSFFQGVLEFIVQLFLNWTVWGILISHWDEISKFIGDTWNGIFSFFQTIGAAISHWWTGYWIGIIAFFQNVFAGIGNFIGGIFRGVANIIIDNVNFVIGMINTLIDGLNVALDGLSVVSGGTINLQVDKLGTIPRLAKGGYVTGPTTALIGEAGPEVVTPLKDFERMMGLNGGGQGQTVIYNAAPNASIDSEQALTDALKRAKVLSAW
jgi:phage-related protein